LQNYYIKGEKQVEEDTDRNVSFKLKKMKTNIEQYFEKNRGNFDLSEPDAGHFERFRSKLENKDRDSEGRSSISYYLMAIAASVLLVFGYWLGNYNSTQGLELADVSPQMEETQNFYTSSIRKEMEQIGNKRTETNAKIIDDAFKQLEILETNYQKLTLELKESGADKRVIHAMITNFQNRLFVLQNLMDQLEELENMAPEENRV